MYLLKVGLHIFTVKVKVTKFQLYRSKLARLQGCWGNKYFTLRFSFFQFNLSKYPGFAFEEKYVV